MKNTIANIIFATSIGIVVGFAAFFIPAYYKKPSIAERVLNTEVFSGVIKFSVNKHSILCTNDDGTFSKFTKDEFFLIPETNQKNCDVYEYTGQISIKE